MFFKNSVGFVLPNCLNAKKKNTFGMRNTQYSIELSVHKQPSVFNTTYTTYKLPKYNSIILSLRF